jgi:hypothetical protein
MCHTADINVQKYRTYKPTSADFTGTEEYEQVCTYRQAAEIIVHYCGQGKKADSI